MSRVLGPGVLAEQKSVTTTTLKWAGVQVQLEISKYNKDNRLTKQTISIFNSPLQPCDFGDTAMRLDAKDLSGLIDLLTQIRTVRDVENDKV